MNLPAPERAPQEHAEQAATMASAVWNDLNTFRRLHRTDDGYHFAYAGRLYTLTRTAAPGWQVRLENPTGTQPFTSGATWTGLTPRAAVTTMVTAAYSHPCPDGYTTGRDSCPGCDAHLETFTA